MGFVFFLIFAAIWYLPLFLKHRKITAEPAKYYVQAFVLGIVAAFISGAIQIGYAGLLYVFGIKTAELPTIARLVVFTLKTLIVIACVEELFKCLAGRSVTKRIPDLSETGCMLIFGMTGLGFEFVESVLSGATSDVFVGILRGITDMHIFLQIWMGMYLWNAWKAKEQGDDVACKKSLRTALIVPILVHFVYDWFVLEGNSLIASEDDMTSILGALAMIVYIVIALVFMIITLRKASRRLKEEKIANINQ